MINKIFSSIICVIVLCSFSKDCDHDIDYEDTERYSDVKINLIKSEISYCKYIVWKMQVHDISIKDGLPWIYEILETIEGQMTDKKEEGGFEDWCYLVKSNSTPV